MLSPDLNPLSPLRESGFLPFGEGKREEESPLPLGGG